MRNTEQLTNFEIELFVPNTNFTETQKSRFKIFVEYTKESTAHYMRGTRVGTYDFEDSYFRLTIPNYIYDYLFDKKEKYTKNKGFIKTLRDTNLKGLMDKFRELTNDCIFLKQIEDLSNFNKVIFVNSNFYQSKDIDNFNSGIRGNKLNLNFQFFVAYKVIKKKNLNLQYWQIQSDVSDEVIEYYAIEKAKSMVNHDRQIPTLTGYNLKEFKEIEWTEERERFFLEIELKINLISTKITEFVDNINTNNVDNLIERKIKLLEDKK